MYFKQVLNWTISLSLLVISSSSCKTYDNIAYFKDVPDSANLIFRTAQSRPLYIEKGDILSIAVFTLDPSANSIFSQQGSYYKSTFSNNTDNSQGIAALNTSNSPVYDVGENGLVEIPLLGKFHAVGITTDSLRSEIEAKAAKIYKLPTVIIRFANLRIGVMGEVNKPGLISLSNEKTTILDAILAAGDLTIFGKRGNLIMIRDSAGFTRMQRFSLNSKDLVKNDYYYLKQNDIIYVQPDKSKAAVLDEDKLRLYSLLTTGVTLFAALIYLFKR